MMVIPALKRIRKFTHPLVAAGCLFGLLLFPGCKEIFQRSLDNVKVILTAPANDLVADSAGQTFYWQPVDTNITYELQIVTPRFDSVVTLVIDTTLATNIFPATLLPAQYQWRVRAFNSTSTTAYSVPWNLTIN